MHNNQPLRFWYACLKYLTVSLSSLFDSFNLKSTSKMQVFGRVSVHGWSPSIHGVLQLPFQYTPSWHSPLSLSPQLALSWNPQCWEPQRHPLLEHSGIPPQEQEWLPVALGVCMGPCTPFKKERIFLVMSLRTTEGYTCTANKITWNSSSVASQKYLIGSQCDHDTWPNASNKRIPLFTHPEKSRIRPLWSPVWLVQTGYWLQ